MLQVAEVLRWQAELQGADGLYKPVVLHHPCSKEACQHTRKGHLRTECCDLLFCQVHPSFSVLSQAPREALLHCHTLSIKNVVGTLITLKSTCL